MNKFKILTIKNTENLPKTSGVYSFYAKNEIIYIGKAVNIKNRVKNHFSQPSYRDNLFIDKVSKIGFIETNSEIEALILEAGLIKKYQPKFNVMWRDDKNYFYVAISSPHDRPYIFITHQKKDLKTTYIGPFTEGQALKKTLRFLRRAFPYYSVKKHPKTKCTYCHLDLCPGPNPDILAYKKNIKRLILILQGRRGAVLRSLKKEMKHLAKKNQFEGAGKVRDRIFALMQIMAHSHIIENSGFLPNGKKPRSNTPEILAKIINAKNIVRRIECYDVSNIQGSNATGSMVVFVDGAPDKSQYKKFKIEALARSNDILMLKEIILRRLAHKEWKYPDAILVDGGRAQLNAAVSSIKQQVLNKKIKAISIAKGRQELFIEGKPGPIPLKSLSQEAYNLIKHLDDEAHRFAIAYHKKLRKRSLLQ